MIDLGRSNFTEVWQRDITSGSSVVEEGICLVATQTGTVETVAPSAATTGEVFVGFATGDVTTKAYRSIVEEYTIPSDANTVTLNHNPVVADNIQVYDDTTGAYLTEGNPANANEYTCTDATGLLTFNAARRGDEITVYYRYTLTVLEAQQLYWERGANIGANQWATNIGVIRGSGEIFVDTWLASVQWALTDTPVTAANGMISNAGNGSTIGRVISVPTVDDPFLGIAFNLA